MENTCTPQKPTSDSESLQKFMVSKFFWLNLEVTSEVIGKLWCRKIVIHSKNITVITSEVTSKLSQNSFEPLNFWSDSESLGGFCGVSDNMTLHHTHDYNLFHIIRNGTQWTACFTKAKNKINKCLHTNCNCTPLLKVIRLYLERDLITLRPPGGSECQFSHFMLTPNGRLNYFCWTITTLCLNCSGNVWGSN